MLHPPNPSCAPQVQEERSQGNGGEMETGYSSTFIHMGGFKMMMERNYW